MLQLVRQQIFIIFACAKKCAKLLGGGGNARWSSNRFPLFASSLCTIVLHFIYAMPYAIPLPYSGGGEEGGGGCCKPLQIAKWFGQLGNVLFLSLLLVHGPVHWEWVSMQCAWHRHAQHAPSGCDVHAHRDLAVTSRKTVLHTIMTFFALLLMYAQYCSVFCAIF